MKNVSHALPQRRQFLAMQVGYAHPVHLYFPLVGRNQAVDVLQQHALAHARRPQQRHRFTTLYIEIDTVQDDVVPESLVDVAQGNHCTTPPFPSV